MKVLLLTREFPPHIYGGAGVVVRELAAALRRIASVEVRCFGDQSIDEPGYRVRGYEPWPRVKREGEERYATALETLSTNLAMARDAVDADVVHAHTWYADFGGFLVKQIHGIPLVVTLHSMEPLRPWKAEQLDRGYAVSTWMEKTGVEAADRVVAVSGEMRRDILAHFDVSPERVTVVPNGVDLSIWSPTDRTDALAEMGVRPPYVLFVGRVSRQKGILVLLEAAKALPRDVQVVLCAGTPDTPEAMAEIEAAIDGDPRLLWRREWTPTEQLRQLYSHASLFCCPSIYEPFGLINLEAMACGAPVVASRTGGIPEVVLDGRTGLLVPPNDAPTLADAIRRVIEDQALARRFREEGRRRAETEFSWDRVAQRTTDLYRECVG